MRIKHLTAFIFLPLFLLIFLLIYSPHVFALNSDFSTAEQDFIEKNSDWIVGFVENKNVEGKADSHFNLGNEFLSVIADQLKVTLVYRRFSSTQDMDVALCQKSIDVAADVSIGSKRSSCAIFSPVYLKVPALMVGAEALVKGASVESLLKLRILSVVGDSTADWLKILHTDIPVREVESFSEAVNLIKSGRADILIENGAGAYPVLDSLWADRLAIKEIPDLETSLRFAFPNDSSLLSSIVTKVMSRLSPAILSQIKSHWLIGASLSSSFNLSETEREYIASLPALRVAYDPDWRPIAYLDSDGAMDGLAKDYWQEIISKLGLKTVLVPSNSWKQLLFKMASGDAEIILPVTYAESNSGQVLYTRPFISFSNVIVTAGARVSRLTELNGKKLVISDPLYLRNQLKVLVPNSVIEIADSPSAAMQKVVDGNAFAYIGNFSVINALMIKHFSGALQIVSPIEISGDLSIGVISKYEKLVPIINRALSFIPKERRKLINDKWLHTQPQEGISWTTIRGYLWGSLSIVVLVGSILICFYLSLRKEINQRRNAERSVGDQLQLREALIETFPYPVVVKDVEKRYLLINNAYELAFNIQKKDLLGKTTLQSMHYPKGWSFKVDELCTYVMNKREVFHAELSIPNHRGEMRTWLYWIKPFYRVDEALAGVMVSLVDITDIRQVDEKAKALEARLNRVTSNLLVGVFEAVQERGQLPVFSYLAGPIEELLGKKIADVLENSSLLFGAIHVDDLRLLMADMELSAEAQQPIRAFLRFCSPSREMHIRVDAVPEYTVSGAITWNGVWVDATESIEQSKKLSVAKEAAEEATHAKSQFLASMSHEIRTPMNGILGLLELLHSKSMSSDQQQIMRLIDGSAKSLMTVLNDILDLSKIEFNQLELSFQRTDLRALISSIMGVMAHQAHIKGVRVRVAISPVLANAVDIDDMRLRQVLTNLLSNAIKFTAIGSILLEVVATDDGPGHQKLIITVYDTGQGMNSAQLERVFKPFTQGDESITRRYGGTGLGLVISRHLVTLMGGELNLYSKEGEGTQASIVLTVKTFGVEEQSRTLSGKLVCVDLVDKDDREELTYFLLALGSTLVSATDIESKSACDLYFFDESIVLNNIPGGCSVAVSSLPILSGWQDTGVGCPTVSSNPYMWESVVYVCNRILGSSGGNTITQLCKFERERPLILVAEDHPTNQALIKGQLDRLGFDCEIAVNGSEALNQFNENVHCMLITDCYMPVMDGYTLARKVRSKLRRPQHFPILAMTASILVEERQRCVAARIDECLLKPLSLDTLRQALKQWMPDFSVVSCRGLSVVEGEDWKDLLSLFNESPEYKIIVEGFVDSTLKDIKYIETLSASESIEQIIQELHRMRGGLRIFKLSLLAERSECLERDLAEMQWGESSIKLFVFLRDVEVILEHMKAMIVPGAI